MHDHDAARRQEIAARVEYWIKRRGLTRKVFADRIGKSVSWVDKIKSGDRQLDRLTVLRQIADVLDVSLNALVDEDEARRAAECPDAAEVAAIKEALQRYDGICTGHTVGEEPDLRRLREAVQYGWASFQASNYKEIGRMLPNLLVDLQQAVRMLSEDEQASAAKLLVQTYQLTAEACFKLGRADLGWLAADRGIVVAYS